VATRRSPTWNASPSFATPNLCGKCVMLFMTVARAMHQNLRPFHRERPTKFGLQMPLMWTMSPNMAAMFVHWFRKMSQSEIETPRILTPHIQGFFPFLFRSCWQSFYRHLAVETNRERADCSTLATCWKHVSAVLLRTTAARETNNTQVAFTVLVRSKFSSVVKSSVFFDVFPWCLGLPPILVEQFGQLLNFAVLPEKKHGREEVSRQVNG
jgi:hypothetical protein